MSHRRLWVPAVLLLLLVPAAPLAGQPALSGPEVRLGHVVSSWDHSRAMLLAHPQGEMTCVWMAWPSADQGPLYQARRLDARGRPMGPEILLGPGRDVEVATAGSGFVAVNLWGTDGGGWAQVFDAGGRPQGSPFRPDAPAPPQPVPTFHAASDRDGGFLFVWTAPDPVTQQKTVFLRRFSAAGAPRGEAVKLAAARGASSIARAPGGEMVVLWFEGPALYGQLFNRSDRPVGIPFRINPRLAVGSPPAVAFFADGGFLVAWEGYPADIHDSPDSRVWGRLYDRKGRALGKAYRLREEEGDPVLAAAGSGGVYLAVLTWNWREPAGAGIHVRQLASDGTQGPELVIPGSSLPAGWPLAAAGWEDGRFALAWGRSPDSASAPDLVVQRFGSVASPGVLRFELGQSATAEGDGPLEIRVERREGNRGEVSATYRLLARSARAAEDFLAASGRVTFADGESLPRTIPVPVLDDALPEADEVLLVALSDPTGGSVLGSPFRMRFEIRDDDTPFPFARESPLFEIERSYRSLLAPAVAVLPGGGFMTAWEEDSSEYRYRLGEALFDAGGGEVSRTCWGVLEASEICLVAHPGGGFTMAAQVSGQSWPSGRAAQRFDGAGRPRGESFLLAARPVACAAGRSGGLLTLSQEPDGGDLSVFLALYGTAGGLRGSLRRVDRTPARAMVGTRPALASDAAGRGIVVWRGLSLSGDRIYAQRVDAAGQRVGKEIVVDLLPGRYPGHPAVAAAPDGRFVVTWEGDDGHGTGIFARLFAADGAPLGGAIQVSSHVAGDQTRPRVAMQGDGRFLVLWNRPDPDDGSPQLAGQRFAADGTRLGPELTFEAGADAALAVNAAGRYVMIWTELETESWDYKVVGRWME